MIEVTDPYQKAIFVIAFLLGFLCLYLQSRVKRYLRDRYPDTALELEDDNSRFMRFDFSESSFRKFIVSNAYRNLNDPVLNRRIELFWLSGWVFISWIGASFIFVALKKFGLI